MQYLIMCRSVTRAQRAASILERKGIFASVIKAPSGLNTKGCGYALSLYRDYYEALRILELNELLDGKRYINDGGIYRELLDDIS